MQIFTSVPNALGLILLIVAMVVFAASLLVLFLAWYHAEFPPLRAKNLTLTSLALFSSLFFYAGLVHSLDIFSPALNVAALKSCDVWRVWLQFILGLGLLNMVITLRLYTLYYLFRLNRAPTVFKRILPPLLLWLPWLGFGIVAFWLPASTIGLDIESGQCVASAWWQATLSLWLGLAWLIQVVLAVLLRGIRGMVAEYTESVVGMAAVAIGVMTVVLVSFAKLQTTIAGVVIYLVVNILALQTYFYVVLGRVMYGTLFHREHTLREFVLDMQQEGSEQQQQMRAQTTGQIQLNLDGSYKQMMRSQSGVGAMGSGMSIGTPELNY